VLPGCKIGDDVVIAANSAVVCDIPNEEVWGDLQKELHRRVILGINKKQE